VPEPDCRWTANGRTAWQHSIDRGAALMQESRIRSKNQCSCWQTTKRRYTRLEDFADWSTSTIIIMNNLKSIHNDCDTDDTGGRAGWGRRKPLPPLGQSYPCRERRPSKPRTGQPTAGVMIRPAPQRPVN